MSAGLVEAELPFLFTPWKYDSLHLHLCICVLDRPTVSKWPLFNLNSNFVKEEAGGVQTFCYCGPPIFQFLVGRHKVVQRLQGIAVKHRLIVSSWIHRENKNKHAPDWMSQIQDWTLIKTHDDAWHESWASLTPELCFVCQWLICRCTSASSQNKIFHRAIRKRTESLKPV